MFTRILIANRGEIACRIIRTLDRMGIESVAVYSDADAGSLHVRMATRAISLGGLTAAESYLRAERILEIAQETGCDAIHPGYGFLSENAAFAQTCEEHGIAFIGPTPAQIRDFGLKHVARKLAQQAGVPLTPGSQLLSSAQEAQMQAQQIGYPVMLKSSAGGGGIGMRLCRDPAELSEGYDAVVRLGQSHFKDSGVYLEKYIEHARHIEVQIFGDGAGRIQALGERDCSVQRRNQKVIEETPAPHLIPATRTALAEAAIRLGESVQYRSAGTVEFILDEETHQFYFLEVNTRLQVEHGVTESVFGIDLVEWMVRQAANEGTADIWQPRTPSGCSIEVRIYAEDPDQDFRPSTGTLSQVVYPQNVRWDGWIETGTEVTPWYDPLLAKLVVHAPDRVAAIERLQEGLAATRIDGIESNLAYLRSISAHPAFGNGGVTTQFLRANTFAHDAIEVIEPGTQTSVQDYPGRLGYWEVGVPPSGPMDNYAFRIANRLVGNPENAAALELTVSGPTLRFSKPCLIALTGAHMAAQLDGKDIPFWQAVEVDAGSVLSIGSLTGYGCRACLALRGGIDVPAYLGSRSTFALGGFGGHSGRCLLAGDKLRLLTNENYTKPQPAAADPQIAPTYTNHSDIAVLYGPHGAPDFFTTEDIEEFFRTDWKVHYNSNRTGVRLIGPRPRWARTDGGEAGLHPSNIHDTAYAVGTIDFTGDMPVILGPDGPSLGGFVCPATIISADLWKVGQLRPGDTVRFHPVEETTATAQEQTQIQAITNLSVSDFRLPHSDFRIPNFHLPTSISQLPASRSQTKSPIIHQITATHGGTEVVYRQDGDKNILVEYGPMVLDFRLRFRVHALVTALHNRCIEGLIDLTPGIRSLQIHFDSRIISTRKLIDLLVEIEQQLPENNQLEVPSRTVYLPLSWDDSSTREAIRKYMQSVRPDAPWCPSNIEFIRRINGLATIEEVKDIVFSARYMVLGLGDVYLGAPVATPLDPRHRLVTTKYNPARTWTPQNAVGIGGAYMCIYGMEGPGGYQFVGRTIQVWNTHRQPPPFKDSNPWLLRHFDQIRFFPVSETELLEMRRDFPHGRYPLRIEEGVFRMADYQEFLRVNADSIQAFKTQQQQAFEEERQRWKEQQPDLLSANNQEAATTENETLTLDPNSRAVAAPVTGNVWKIHVCEGIAVHKGDLLVTIEAMKMELSVFASCDGTISRIIARQGCPVNAGDPIAVIHSG